MRGPAFAKHILVPIDLSSHNARALDAALALAEGVGARVTVLHVIQEIEGVPIAEMRAFLRGVEQLVAKRLDAATRKFHSRGVRVEGVVLTGTPPREIVSYAAQKRVDLIVMGSHTIGSRPRLGRGLGTTSYQVAILCRCPVLLLK